MADNDAPPAQPETDPEAEKKFEKDDLKDEEGNLGPAPNRGCTDIFCIPVFIAAQVIWVIVTIIGLANGNPSKLYLPRDFQGAYCGVETNWNNGPNTVNQEYLSYTMNVSATTYTIMKQTVCSTAARNVLINGPQSLLSTQTEQDNYLCDCCLVPCAKCDGAEDNGGDISSFTSLASGASSIASRMQDLTDPSRAMNLFSPSGSNGATFSANSFWQEATKYLYMVCLPSCTVNFNTINSTQADQLRSFTYTPSRDDALYTVWEALRTGIPTGGGAAINSAAANAFQSTVSSAFTFSALPESVCPYEPSFCVPFPGVQFDQLASSNYCTMEMAAEVATAIGGAAADALSSIGATDFAEGATQEFGDQLGDFLQVIDTFILTAVCSFVIGIVFLILLRWFIGICVWIAILFTVIIFIIAGSLTMVRSYQCADSGLFETGTQSAVAIGAAGVASVSQATGMTDEASEEMTGDGADYRGNQQITKNGNACDNWDSQSKMPQYTSSNYTTLDNARNFCRNPYNANDANKASTIWCITNDPNVYWEECMPIGVIAPDCNNGYAVAGESMRQILWWASFVIWAIGLIWIIVILCFAGRIQLAVALNKVGALFLSHNPSIVLVPVVQAFVGILWVLAWCFGASFLLSQVPDGWVSTGGFSTYAEAYGTTASCAIWEAWTDDSCTEGIPGQCNGEWPTGFVWKDVHCGDAEDPKCFKCAPPRYVLDWRFAVSFFVFLWNIEFNLSMGQMLIAMAVSIWFFIKTEEKWKRFVVPKAVKTAFRYHVGSVMFGSFIVAVIQFIRYLMKYFEKQAAAQKQRILVLILKCVQCCIYCFEKCVKFINKNAYIQIALKGKNFCTSAKAAFWLISRNFLRFGTVAALGGAVHAIGFFFIMVCTVLVGYFMLQAMHPDISPLVPCFTFLFVGYVCSKLFMNVFGLSVDTALQCFIATEEMGGDEGFVPDCLDSFVKEHNKEESA